MGASLRSFFIIYYHTILVVTFCVSAKQWESMLRLTKKAGVRYLHDFNLQLRFGTQWDPSNAIAVINHIRLKGLADNLDFELGNGILSLTSCCSYKIRFSKFSNVFLHEEYMLHVIHNLVKLTQKKVLHFTGI